MTSAPLAALAVALTFLSLAGTGSAQSRVRGATYLGHNLILFDEHFRVLSAPSYGGVEVFGQRYFGAPRSFLITAVTSRKAAFIFVKFVFFGQDQIFYNHKVLRYPDDYPRHAHLFPDFLWHGIDAATAEGPVAYYIKGCRFIKRVEWAWHLEPQDVASLQIPCDVDAAWYHDGDHFVLKGDQVWKVGHDVNSPTSFRSYRPYSSMRLLAPRSTTDAPSTTSTPGQE